MYMKHLLIFLSFLCVLSGCSISKYTSVTQSLSFDKYRYFCVTDASTVTAGSGSVYGNKYGVYGSQTTKTASPSDIIAGNLMKRGFIRLPSTNPETVGETMIVSYGEGGRRFMGYAVEVTLQFMDAKTMEVIAATTAVGMGDTESDGVRIAINKCFKALFSQ